MTQSSKNKIFTAQDIERYHAGQMPPAERHALEKAALDDPFLADALEGYAYTHTPGADLQLLREKLAPKQKPERSKLFSMFRSTALRAAVVIAFVAGGAWFAYRAFLQPEQELAVIKHEPSKNSTAAPDSGAFVNAPRGGADTTVPGTPTAGRTLPLTDSVAIDPSAANGIPPILNQEKDLTIDEQPPVQAPPAAQGKKEREDASNDLAYKRNNDNGYAPRNATPSENNYFRNRNSPSPDNNALGNNRRQETAETKQAMEENNILRKIKDGPALDSGVDNMLRDKAATMRKIDTITNLNIVLKEQQLPPSEVIVLGSGTSGNVAARPQAKVDTLEPAQGWAYFDSYVATNLKTPDYFKTKEAARGEVQLSFDVNRQGEPVNITVTKSLCQKCDEEAIRLLKEGPKWKRKKNNKGTVTIRF